MAIRRFNEMENVGGGVVRQFRERPDAGNYGFKIENKKELEAYADFLESYCRDDGEWEDSEGNIVNGKILSDAWREEAKNFRSPEYFFFPNGKEVYAAFKDYCEGKRLDIQFKDL